MFISIHKSCLSRYTISIFGVSRLFVTWVYFIFIRLANKRLIRDLGMWCQSWVYVWLVKHYIIYLNLYRNLCILLYWSAIGIPDTTFQIWLKLNFHFHFHFQKLQSCSFPDQSDTRSLQFARNSFETRWREICRDVTQQLRHSQDRITLCREFTNDYKQLTTWLGVFENKVSIPGGRCEDLQELSLEISRLQVCYQYYSQFCQTGTGTNSQRNSFVFAIPLEYYKCNKIRYKRISCIS